MKLGERQSLQLDEGRTTSGFSGDPLAFLDQGLIDRQTLAVARREASRLKLPLSQLLCSQGLVSKQTFIKELARYHGLNCLLEPTDLEGYEIDGLPGLDRPDFDGLVEKSGVVNLKRHGEEYIAFDVLHYSDNTLKLFFANLPVAKGRLLLMSPAIKRVLNLGLDQQARLHQAVYGLSETHEGFSAKDKTTYAQKLVLGFLFGLVGGGLFLSPVATLYGLGTLLNLLFFYAIMLRLFAVVTLSSNKQTDRNNSISEVQNRQAGAEHLPIYTILVPLFKEQRIVAQLIDNLLALDYPHERLDIKLIFEQGDEATLLAARACQPPAWFEFVIVPDQQPQTKPKALNYALASARGELVVVYDAEDRPDPDQLRKAVAAFKSAEQSDDKQRSENRPLACLQAGLNHYNVDENWMARQFTIEYTALFDGLLPALQRLDLPIMLGGTSNHFRTDILRDIGGWDAFNVTEDADLGIRLMRLGFRCEMLPSTTYEEACCRPRDWVRQRTRWLKGWLQTYLVHMRHPVTLFQQLGARGFSGFQIILGAQVLSLVAHPIFIVFMAYEALWGDLFKSPYGLFSMVFWGLALGNFILGYGVSIWLGFATMRRRGYMRLIWQLPLMPLYWLLISFATFRALVHYVVKPFFWEKTEHGLGKSQANPPDIVQ